METLPKIRIMRLDRLRQDVSYALRTLQQTPGFALVAILTLAIGIAAATAVATAANAVFLQLPPVHDPSAVRMLSWMSARRAFTNAVFRGPGFDARHIDSFPEEMCRDIQRRSTSFSHVACWRAATDTLTDDGLWRVHAVSGNFLDTLGIAAVAGRTLTAADDDVNAPLVAMTRDRALLGRELRMYGHVFTVVGVLPEAFTGLAPLSPADVIVPYAADRLFPVFQRNAWTESRIVVRLRHGVTDDRARAETEVLVHQLIQAAPPRDAYDPPRLFLDELASSRVEMQQNVTRPLALLGATVALLLGITCANIGGLLFARGRGRGRELATRLALGGSRRRLVQQLLTESLVLGLAGALVGIALAYASTPILPRLLSALGNAAAVGVVLEPDARVLLFAIVMSVGCAVLCGLLPAIGVTRVNPAHALKQASGVAPAAKLRAGKMALAIQLALSIVVIAGAGLLVRTMINLRAVALGYQPEGLVFVETNNPVGRPRAVVDDTVAALRALPGITSATASQWPIFNNAMPRFPICVPTGDLTPQQLDYSFVLPGFFDTWGVRFAAGRDIDDSTAPQVVVNETFVRQYLRGRNPVGEMISFGNAGCPGKTQVPIVGVVADHIDRQRVELIPSVYARYPRAGALYVTTYAVRTAGDERAIMPAVRRVINDRSIAPNRDVRMAVEYRDSVMRQERALTILLVLFGMTALFISCLGIYGMLNYTVTWRLGEISLRMAIGAQPLAVAWMITRESLVPVVAGMAIGLAGAVGAVRWVQSLLFGVTPHDPVTIVTAAVVLVVAAGVASWFPARRATRVDPVPALRCE